MKAKSLALVLPVVSLLMLVSGTSASAEELRPERLRGLINDYSPASVKGGPWEMHGQWSIDLHRDWGGEYTADFFADMTMSGYVTTTVVTPGTPEGIVAVQTQSGVNPHTHHIQLNNVKVTWDMTGCPIYLPPATLPGFQMTGTVSLITGNGGIPPFEPTPPTTSLQVCVTGGTEVPYSNVTLVFTGPATSHFGMQAIHGVVRTITEHRIL
jgi:hypothetical protein